MKKIFNIVCIVLSAISLCACSDDTENPYAEETSVQLVATDVDFDATASTGTIVFKALGEVNAVSAAEWCTTEVTGDTVKVSVKQNITIVGRSTVVTLICGDDELDVAVTQQGVVFQPEKSMVAVPSDEAQTLTYSLKSNVNLMVEYAPEWAAVTLEDDKMNISLSENGTGHIRQDYIKFRSGDFVDSLQIMQADFDKDIAGTYTMYYIDDKDRERTARVTLTKNELQIKSPKLDIPISFDSETMSVSVECGQYCGSVRTNTGTSYIYITFSTLDLIWSQYYDNDFSTATVTYGDLVNNPGKKGNSLAFGGYFLDTYPIDGFAFWKSTSADELNENTDAKGYLLLMFNPRMERVIE